MVPTGWLVEPPWRYCRKVSVVEYDGYWRPETGKGWPGPINELKDYQIKRCQLLTDAIHISGNRRRGKTRYAQYWRPLVERRD